MVLVFVHVCVLYRHTGFLLLENVVPWSTLMLQKGLLVSVPLLRRT